MRGVYLLVGAALLAVGVLGYFQNPILGVITANPYHNLLHVGSGLATLAAARRGILAMRRWGTLAGLFYSALALGGAALRRGDFFGLMHLDRPDNIMHAALAAIFLYYAWLSPPR
jgi:Domain of unknown function (DUF4383)